MVERSRQIRRVLLYTFVANEAVAIIKITWGVLSGSLGMISDGFHSLFDGVTNILGLIGIWIASHPPDKEHPYGHKKFETVFTLIVSGMIFLTCYEVLKGVWRTMHTGSNITVSAESFIIMGLTIVVNFVVMRYELKKSGELKSAFLRADALHTKSNLLSSAGVVGGLILSAAGFPMADVIAGVVVAGFIAKIGFEIMKEATGVLVDSACLDTTAVENVVMSVEGVQDCHQIRARGTVDHVHLDLHIKLNPRTPLQDAHRISHIVQDRIREEFPQVGDIVVHVEPA